MRIARFATQTKAVECCSLLFFVHCYCIVLLFCLAVGNANERVLRRSQRLSQKLKASQDVLEKCHTESLTLSQTKCAAKPVPSKRAPRKTPTKTPVPVNTLCIRKPRGRPRKYFAMPQLQCYNDNALLRAPFVQQQQQRDSMLPPIYPTHFKRQLPPAPLFAPAAQPPNMLLLTPEISDEYDVDAALAPPPSSSSSASSSSSPKLPACLRGVFETDNLRELLHIERTAYRLTDRHVQALARMLRMDVARMRRTLDTVLRLPERLLAEMAVDDGAHAGDSDSVSAVSGSPVQMLQVRHFASQTKGPRAAHTK